MPILIRETNIKANLSDEDAGADKNGKNRTVGATAPVADLEGQIHKILLRKIKTRDER